MGKAKAILTGFFRKGGVLEGEQGTILMGMAALAIVGVNMMPAAEPGPGYTYQPFVVSPLYGEVIDRVQFETDAAFGTGAFLILNQDDLAKGRVDRLFDVLQVPGLMEYAELSPEPAPRFGEHAMVTSAPGGPVCVVAGMMAYEDFDDILPEGTEADETLLADAHAWALYRQVGNCLEDLTPEQAEIFAALMIRKSGVHPDVTAVLATGGSGNPGTALAVLSDQDSAVDDRLHGTDMTEVAAYAREISGTRHGDIVVAQLSVR